MTETGRARGAPFAFLTRDVGRQRTAARGLLGHVEALDRLLANDTAALGTDEIAFLGRLRADLLCHARSLADNADHTARRAIAALRAEQE